MEEDSDVQESLMRRKKIKELKEKKASLEASRGIVGDKSPARSIRSYKLASMNSPTLRSSNRRTSSSRGLEGFDVPSDSDTPPRSPAMQSTSRSSEEDYKETTTKSQEETKLPSRKSSWLGPPVKKLSLGGSFVEHSSSSNSDDSGIGGQTLEKYKKYLDDDKVESEKPRGNTPEKERNTYDEYRNKLSQKKENEKWVAPKKKLGAPPSLDFERSMDNITLDSSITDDSRMDSSSTTTARREKLKLESQKIAADDLGILASMLGNDDSDEEIEASEGASSVYPGDDELYVNRKSSNDDDVKMLRGEERRAVTPVSVSAAAVQAADENTDRGDIAIQNQSSKSKNVEDRVEAGDLNPEESNEVEKRSVPETRIRVQETLGMSAEAWSHQNRSTESITIEHHEEAEQRLPASSSDPDGRMVSEASFQVRGFSIVPDDDSSRNDDGFSSTSEMNVAEEFSSSRGNKLDPSSSSFSSNNDFEKVYAFSSPRSQRSSTDLKGSDAELTEPKPFSGYHSQSKMVDISSSDGDASEGTLDFDEVTGLEKFSMEESSFRAKMGNDLKDNDEDEGSITLGEVALASVLAAAAIKDRTLSPSSASNSDRKRAGDEDIYRRGPPERRTLNQIDSSKTGFSTSPNQSERTRRSGHAALKSTIISPQQLRERQDLSDDDGEINHRKGPSSLAATPLISGQGAGTTKDYEGSMTELSLEPENVMSRLKALTMDTSSRDHGFRYHDEDSDVDLEANAPGGSVGIEPIYEESVATPAVVVPLKKSDGKPAEKEVRRPSMVERKSTFTTGPLRWFIRAWVVMLILAALGVLLYFFVFKKESSENPGSSADLFSATPNLAPTGSPSAFPTLVSATGSPELGSPIIPTIQTGPPFIPTMPIGPPVAPAMPIASPVTLSPEFSPIVGESAFPSVGPTPDLSSQFPSMSIPIWTPTTMGPATPSTGERPTTGNPAFSPITPTRSPATPTTPKRLPTTPTTQITPTRLPTTPTTQIHTNSLAGHAYDSDRTNSLADNANDPNHTNSPSQHAYDSDHTNPLTDKAYDSGHTNPLADDSVWPSLEEDFADTDTPQYFALVWLVDNANYDSYPNNQLIQRFALATLYYSTKGNQWRNNDGWLSDIDECAWYSGPSEATCVGNSSVIRLGLDLNNLAGAVPSEIALLSNLVEIDFSTSGWQASLSGSIPTELGLLKKLTSLNLRGHSFGSTIPSTIGNCAAMVNLDLSQAGLIGRIPSEVSKMTNLRVLSLADNHLLGGLPSSIGALTKLEKLQLQRNIISGDLPTEIGKLSLLTSIEMKGNRLTRIPSQLGNLLLLRTISFASNLLQGTIPSTIGNSIELLSLELQGNQLTGTIPTTLGRLVELRDVLDLSDNSLSGRIPSELGRLIFLTKMFLSDNVLTGQVPSSFSNLQRLDLLRLQSNNLGGTVPDSVCDVFSDTISVFISDCAASEIVCACCTTCV